MTKERVAVFIDGNNLYHRFRELGIAQTLWFRYADFASWLVRDRSIVFRGYYVGVVREQEGNAKSRALMAEQRKLFSLLEKDRWTVRRGYLMRSDHAGA